MVKIIKFALLAVFGSIVASTIYNYGFTGFNAEQTARRLIHHPYGILSITKSKSYGDLEILNALKKESDNFDIEDEKVAYIVILSISERSSPEAIGLFKELYSRQQKESGTKKLSYLIGAAGLAANKIFTEKLTPSSYILLNLDPTRHISQNGYLVMISLKILSYLKDPENLPAISKVFSDYPTWSNVRHEACSTMFEVLNHNPNDEYKRICGH